LHETSSCFSENSYFCSKQFYICSKCSYPYKILHILVLDGGKKLSKRSKKEKTAGIEQHKQALREKKMKKKEKKKVAIPANYRKK
jgi:hypothetical protein